jgi:hypothetical protein
VKTNIPKSGSEHGSNQIRIFRASLRAARQGVGDVVGDTVAVGPA